MSRRQRNRRAKRLRHAPVAGLVLGAALVAPAVSQADPFSVTNNDDQTASPSPGSLRKAILDAEAHAGADDIVVHGAYTNAPETISLEGTLPTITQPLTITKTDGGPVTIDGSAVGNSMFVINAAGPVTISGLTLEHGGALGGSVKGGAINSINSDLTLQDSTVSGSQAVDGGGIRQRYGSLTVDHATVSGNDADSTGGGIYGFHAELAIQDGSLVSGNKADSGAGVYADHDSTLISESTISGNTARATAGGVGALVADLTIGHSSVGGNEALNAAGVWSFEGTGTVNASTIRDNRATSYGGGVYTADSALSIFNTTITGNTAATGGGIVDISYGAGPGHLHVDSTTVANNAGGGAAEIGAYPYDPMTLTNSIVACSTSGTDLSVSGGIDPINSYYSLIQNAPSSAFDGHGHTITGQNPLLGPLADNNGQTKTLALAAGSPAIDHGATTLATDQRGDPRPGAGADIGAFERQPGDPVVTPAQCGPPTTSTPVVPITTPAPPQPSLAAVLKVGKFKAGRNVVTVSVSCASAACSGNVALNTFEKLNGKKVVGLAKKLKKKRVKVGSKAYALAAGQTKTVSVKLNAKGRKLLTKYRKMKVRVSVSQRKAATSQVVKTGKVTLKSKAKKKKR